MRNPELRGTLAERAYIVDMFVDFLYGENASEDMAELIGCGWDVLDDRYIVTSPTVVYSGEICKQWDGGDYVHFDRVMAADEEARKITESQFLLALPDPPEVETSLPRDHELTARGYRNFIIGTRVADGASVFAHRNIEGGVTWTVRAPPPYLDLIDGNISEKNRLRYLEIKEGAAPHFVNITTINSKEPPSLADREKTLASMAPTVGAST